MRQVVVFSLLGLGNGALIAGVAIALVTFYRGSGTINLATAAVAMVAGFTFWALHGDAGTIPALLAALVASVVMGLLFEFVALRPLRGSPPLAKLIGSLGVLLVAQAATELAVGSQPYTEPAILPERTVTLLGTPVGLDTLMLAGIVLVVSLLLAAVYRWTKFGLATRAASENQASAMLVGLSPSVLSATNSVLGCVVAGGLGVLAAPVITLDTQNLPLIVVPALAAALFANFTSVTLACLAGLAVGVGESLLYYASVQSWFPTDAGTPLPGVQDLLVFLLIVGILYWRGARLPTRGDIIDRRLPAAPRPQSLLRPALLAAAACAIALIILPFAFRQALMTSMIGTILALSLVLVTGFVGQASAMQLALSGFAGLVVSHLATNAGVGFPLGLIIGALAATALGLVTALCALRIRGISLAVATLAAAVAIQNFGFNNSTWGAGLTGAPVPQPTLLHLDLGNTAAFRGIDGQLPSPVLGFVILAFAVAFCLLVANIRRGGLGLRMLAVRANERAAAAAGVSVRNTKLAAFGIGAFLAGVSGALYGYNFSGVATDQFTALSGLTFLAFVYISGISMVSGAVIAGFISIEGLAQYALQQWFGFDGTWASLAAGLILLGNVVFAPAGAAGMMHAKLELRRRMKLASPPMRQERRFGVRVGLGGTSTSSVDGDEKGRD